MLNISNFFSFKIYRENKNCFFFVPVWHLFHTSFSLFFSKWLDYGHYFKHSLLLALLAHVRRIITYAGRARGHRQCVSAASIGTTSCLTIKVSLDIWSVSPWSTGMSAWPLFPSQACPSAANRGFELPMPLPTAGSSNQQPSLSYQYFRSKQPMPAGQAQSLNRPNEGRRGELRGTNTGNPTPLPESRRREGIE